MKKKISLLEALTGVCFEVEHLDKTKFEVVTMPGDVISHGNLKTIEGKGMPFYRD